jgi:hypothetical protein
MAVTAHWIARVDTRLVLKAALLGFQRVYGSHTGKTLGRHILDIIDRADVTLKVRLKMLLARTRILIP